MLDKIQNKENLSSFDLVHNDFKIIDLKLQTYNKDLFLKLIQHWKDLLSTNNIKSLYLIDYVTADSLAILMACCELGIELLAQDRIEQLREQLQDVDLVLIGELIDGEYQGKFNHHRYSYTKVDQVENINYQAMNINWDCLFLSGYTSGSTGTPKKVSHTSHTFLIAGSIASRFFSNKDTYGPSPKFGHLGVTSLHLVGPLLSGATMYTSQNTIDLFSLCNRKFINKITLFELELREFLASGLSEYIVDLSDIEVYCGGGSPTITFIDWFFSRNGKKIHNFYGTVEVLPPIFVKTILDPTVNIYERDLGKLTNNYCKIKINGQGQLLVDGPSKSTYLTKLDEDNFYNTTDYVRFDENNNHVYYLGRCRLELEPGKFLYQSEVENRINQEIEPLGVIPSEYFVVLKDSKVKIISNTTNSHNVINDNWASITNKFSKTTLEYEQGKANLSGFKVIKAQN